jgi:tetratricopeptide (TPR) repeat protein
MITQLGRLHPRRLSVIARTSSMRYKDRDTPIDQIGRELGVDYVLEGSTRREGSRVRINATLIQVRDQAQRWTDSFDRELAGILSLQSDVARGVARSLALTLLPAEQTRLSRIRPVNPEAYEAYLRGLSHVEKLTRADLDAALQYFESALEKDSAYALAYLGIGFVWSGRQQMGFVAPSEARSRTRAALAKAFELDDTLPDAHFHLALQSTWTDWDFAAAEPHFQRAIDLNPNHAQARAYYAHYLMILRRPDEAMSQMQRAVELDPLNPLIQSLHGGALLMVRRFDEALVQYRNVLRTAPASPLALGGVANALDNLERYE